MRACAWVRVRACVCVRALVCLSCVCVCVCVRACGACLSIRTRVLVACTRAGVCVCAHVYTNVLINIMHARLRLQHTFAERGPVACRAEKPDGALLANARNPTNGADPAVSVSVPEAHPQALAGRAVYKE